MTLKRRDLLEKLGYHPTEAKLYLAALELGEATITELSDYAEIPRTTAMGFMSRMRKQGLLIPYIKKTRKYWVAQNPEKLLSELRAKEGAFSKLMPEFLATKKHKEKKPSIRAFHGAEEVKKILDIIIDSKRNVSALVVIEDLTDALGREYVQEFVRKRAQNFLKMRLIAPKTKISIELKNNDDDDLRHLKFLPREVNLRHITNFIFGDRVAILSLHHSEIRGIVIEDQHVAHGNLLYFESVWDNSTES